MGENKQKSLKKLRKSSQCSEPPEALEPKPRNFYKAPLKRNAKNPTRTAPLSQSLVTKPKK